VVFVLNYWMKKIVFIMAAWLPVLGFSQKDFEGIITYNGFKSAPKNNFHIKIYLSKGNIKAKIFDKEIVEPGDQKIHIYNFNTGIHYLIDDENKRFARDSMNKPSVEDFKTTIKDTSLFENILGYPCRAYTIIPVSEIFDNWTNIMWFSDSLKFIVPEEYRGKRSIETLPDGNMLLLKSIVVIGLDRGHDPINKIDSFYIVADKIEKLALNESEFLPPAGYTLTTMAEMEEVYQDSIQSDSTSNAKELTLTEIKKEQPKTPTPVKSSKPLKSAPKKEKETKPVKG